MKIKIEPKSDVQKDAFGAYAEFYLKDINEAIKQVRQEGFVKAIEEFEKIAEKISFLYQSGDSDFCIWQKELEAKISELKKKGIK